MIYIKLNVDSRSFVSRIIYLRQRWKIPDIFLCDSITNTKFQTCLRVLIGSREGTDRRGYIRIITRVSDVTQLYRKGKMAA